MHDWSALLAGFALVASLSAASQSNTRTILVTAVDGKHQPVPGLTAADFIVKEDGKARRVLDARIAEAPVQVAFMLDDSGLGLGAIRQGAWEVTQALRGKGEFAIVAIGSQNLPVLDFTTEATTVYAALQKLLTRSNPPTYVLDGLLEVTRVFRQREAQRPVVMIVATEGADFSTARAEAVLEAIQASRAQVYCIGLGAPVTQGNHPPYSADRPNDSTEDEAAKLNAVLGAAPGTRVAGANRCSRPRGCRC